ncbi:hypothetical protein Leryth_014994 [Lithospermum erythrorhizon]|nr:hypothetical protein Leryth_014994 [Lithospermum erythrorhizon]
MVGSMVHCHQEVLSVVNFNLDESLACRVATNEVRFYDPCDFSKGFGMPASVQILASGKDLQIQPIARRSFFRFHRRWC